MAGLSRCNNCCRSQVLGSGAAGVADGICDRALGSEPLFSKDFTVMQGGFRPLGDPGHSPDGLHGIFAPRRFPEASPRLFR